MNKYPVQLTNGKRLTGLVALLAVASAISVAGCHAHAVAQDASELMPLAATSAPSAPSAPETAVATTFVGMEPTQPFDEKFVTPMETVGASGRD